MGNRRSLSLMEVTLASGLLVILLTGLMQLWLANTSASMLASERAAVVATATMKLEELRAEAVVSGFDKFLTDQGLGSVASRRVSFHVERSVGGRKVRLQPRRDATVSTVGELVLVRVANDVVLVTLTVRWQGRAGPASYELVTSVVREGA